MSIQFNTPMLSQILGGFAIIILTGYIFYGILPWHHILLWPRPISGIPYNKGIGILGDLPELWNVFRTGDSVRPWFWCLAIRHKSPIVQFFLRPFDKPTVIVADYHETYDILVRRNDEFDRSQRSAAFFSTIIPNHHITMQSSEPRFRVNKDLVKDLMTPSFLNQVSAPIIYKKVGDLIDLWGLKSEVARDQPFAACQDIKDATIDIILAVTFGFHEEWQISKHKHETLTQQGIPKSLDPTAGPFVFENSPLPRRIRAFITVNDSLRVALTSPVPQFHHWILKHTLWRRQFALKEQILTEEISNAVKRQTEVTEDKAPNSAIDCMIQRAMASARRSGRNPQFWSPSMRDELLGFLIAGSDTTSSTLAWAVKFLSDNGGVQAKLRRQLRAAYAEAYANGRRPTATEIVSKSAPYLDAFLEESLRCTRTLPIMMRQTLRDTTILGYRIPKDTTIMLLSRGPSLTEASIPISDSVRSKTSQESRRCMREWDDATIGFFAPERWLGMSVQQPGSDEFDMMQFNPKAGPMITFGGGPRGCFGRRLAYLQLRITTALLVWSFEFQPCCAALSSYEGHDGLATSPKQCYVQLTRI